MIDEKTSISIRANKSGFLSYLLGPIPVVGWIYNIVILALERESRFVKFNALQSLIFFGLCSIAFGILNLFIKIPLIGVLFGIISGSVGLVVLLIWILGMVLSYKGIYFKIPFIGDFVDRIFKY